MIPMALKDRYDAIRTQVVDACAASGRDASAVRIIGVSKTVDVDAVAEAVAAGIHDFGENRPDELARKHDAFPSERWHFIGNIQSRHLKDVVGRACLIHSLYRPSHADKIDRLADAAGIVQDVLIEVNDGEENKQGLSASELPAMIEHCLGLAHVRVRGLMMMAPKDSPEEADASFARLARIREEMRQRFVAQGLTLDLDELSMGMSDDYLQAIPYGSTMVRIGRAIFSDTYGLCG